MGLVTVHAWYADRFQTLCDITGVNKTSGLIRHTTIPVNCPTCLKMLLRHGFDEYKHEIMQNEYSITRRTKTMPPLATPIKEKEFIENNQIEEVEEIAQYFTENIPDEEVTEEQLIENVAGRIINESGPINIVTIGTEDNPATEEDINKAKEELLIQQEITPGKTEAVPEIKLVEEVEIEKSLSSKPASKKPQKTTKKPKR